MNDISEYLSLTKTSSSIKGINTIPIDFKTYYLNVSELEKKSLIRHFIVNNVPFVFKEKPLLYEQITQYIGDKLRISPSEIKLIGSAKTGFSISPSPKYGKWFGSHSDLDFSIINERLFLSLQNEFYEWENHFKLKQIIPSNPTEEKYWIANLDSGPRQINNGFIDTRFIPNRNLFILTRTINNSLWLVQKHLDDRYQIKVKKATASIYKNWESFAERLNRNTNYVMKTV